jgi:hypothetical protein
MRDRCQEGQSGFRLLDGVVLITEQAVRVRFPTRFCCQGSALHFDVRIVGRAQSPCGISEPLSAEISRTQTGIYLINPMYTGHSGYHLLIADNPRAISFCFNLEFQAKIAK